MLKIASLYTVWAAENGMPCIYPGNASIFLFTFVQLGCNNCLNMNTFNGNEENLQSHDNPKLEAAWIELHYLLTQYNNDVFQTP